MMTITIIIVYFVVLLLFKLIRNDTNELMRLPCLASSRFKYGLILFVLNH